MAKYDQLSNLLKRRILNGDYAIKGLPAERQLAIENGVAHMTARRALLQLESEGILVRAANGRLGINTSVESSVRPLQVAFLAPSFSSPAIDLWSEVLESALTPFGGSVRRIHYSHWEDPVITDTLNGFDGRFFLPCADIITPELTRRLLSLESPVVLLNDDQSAIGIPSVRLIPPIFVQKLLVHLEGQGHKQVACLNVQPHDDVINNRIAQWQIWTAAHNLPAPLIDEPVRSFQDPFPQAYAVIRKLLQEKCFTATALFCTTYAAAVGAMRALYEHDIRPGLDVAIGLIDGEGQAAYHIPSLTAIEPPDIVPQLTVCLQWMAQGGKKWQGPLLLQPADVPLVIRESTRYPASLSHHPASPSHHLSMKEFAMLANKGNQP